MLKQKTMHEYDFPPYLSKSYMALSFATISGVGLESPNIAQFCVTTCYVASCD